MNMLDKTAKTAQDLTKNFNDFLTNAESLKPETADPALYNRLVDAVQEATNQNEDIAAFCERLSALGQDVVDLAKTLKLIA